MAKGDGTGRKAPFIGVLAAAICCFASGLVHGFSPRAEIRLPCRKVPFVARAKSSSDDDVLVPSSPLSELSRRSAIAAGAAAALAPLSAALTLSPASAAAAMAATSIPTWTLDGGVEFPVLALNTAGMSVEETYRAIGYARKEGVTHIDFHPGDERDGVSRYLSKHKDERDLLFLNTKIRKAPPGTSPGDAAKLARDQIDEDLRILDVKSVDMLMLRDSPDPKVMQSQWAVMEEALAAGKTRSIGVVNYCQSALSSVLQTAKVVPALNYIMVHVGMGTDVHGLRTLGEKNKIRTFAYGQTGEPEPNVEIVNSPVLQRIGMAHGGKSAEEVALRWVLQNGMAASVRPSSRFGRCVGEECQAGIARQVHCFDWTLTDGEMAELDAMTTPDDNPTLFSSAGCPGAFGM